MKVDQSAPGNVLEQKRRARASQMFTARSKEPSLSESILYTKSMRKPQRFYSFLKGLHQYFASGVIEKFKYFVLGLLGQLVQSLMFHILIWVSSKTCLQSIYKMLLSWQHGKQWKREKLNCLLYLLLKTFSKNSYNGLSRGNYGVSL